MNEIINKIPLEALIGVSAMFISILIPLSLFILESLGSSKSSSILSWDNRVIIKQVLQVKILFIWLLLTAVPLIFWNIDYLRNYILVLCLLGYLGTIRAMYRAYQWIMSKSTDNYSETGLLSKDNLTYRNKMRSQYLNSLKSDDEILEVWGTIFQRQGWAGIDLKLFTQKFVQALKQTEINAVEKFEYKGNNEDIKYDAYQSEQLLISFLTTSLDGKYDESRLSFDTIYSFSPLKDFVLERYAETIDDQEANFNIRFLLKFLMEYVGNCKFYGYDNISESSYSFNQGFYKLLIKLQKMDNETPKDLPRVKETLWSFDEGDYGTFGVLFLEMLDYPRLNWNFSFPEEWVINVANIENNSIVRSWYHSLLKFILEHGRSQNNYYNQSRNKYPEPVKENDKVVAILNYFLPNVSAQKFCEVLELAIGTCALEKNVPNECWESLIKYPEFEVIDYLGFDKDVNEIFDLLDLNFSYFTHSKYVQEYQNSLSRLVFDELSAENMRRNRYIELYEKLIVWQEMRAIK